MFVAIVVMPQVEKKIWKDISIKNIAKISTSSIFILQKYVVEPIRLDKGGYSCPFCSREMNDKTSIKRHIATHTGEKPYICNQCHYSAIQISTLKRHFKSVHKNLMMQKIVKEIS